MGLRGEIFSWRNTIGRRTYFFNVKENRTGDVFLNLVESKKTTRLISSGTRSSFSRKTWKPSWTVSTGPSASSGKGNPEAAPVNRREAQLPHQFAVSAGGITLVHLELVLRRPAGINPHPAVARRFGEDGGGHDRRLRPVAPDDRPAGQSGGRREQPVDQDERGVHAQPLEGAGHGEQRGPVDVQLVDLGGAGPTGGPGYADSPDRRAASPRRRGDRALESARTPGGNSGAGSPPRR